MEVRTCIKKQFSVIGIEGSTCQGEGFVTALWAYANSHFEEVAALAKKDREGNLLGIWGAMSDFSHSFLPWQDGFTKGLYLAGVEVADDAQAPKGWTKWTIPSYEYRYVENEGPDTFTQTIQHLRENDIKLAGAVHEFTCPQSGKAYLFFPIRKL